MIKRQAGKQVKMRNPHNAHPLTIDAVTLNKCEVLTIYARNVKHQKKDEHGWLIPVQIEIRVGPEGNLEIFHDASMISVSTFDSWYAPVWPGVQEGDQMIKKACRAARVPAEPFSRQSRQLKRVIAIAYLKEVHGLSASDVLTLQMVDSVWFYLIACGKATWAQRPRIVSDIIKRVQEGDQADNESAQADMENKE